MPLSKRPLRSPLLYRSRFLRSLRWALQRSKRQLNRRKIGLRISPTPKHSRTPLSTDGLRRKPTASAAMMRNVAGAAVSTTDAPKPDGENPARLLSGRPTPSRETLRFHRGAVQTEGEAFYGQNRKPVLYVFLFVESNLRLASPAGQREGLRRHVASKPGTGREFFI
jgi:hypothetical protein